MDQRLLVESPPAGSINNNVYAFDGKMLIITGISTTLAIVVLLASLQLYARWWLSRERTHVVVIPNNHNPGSAADRGLEPVVLISLPVFIYSSKAKAASMKSEKEQPLLECAVCLSEFEEDETVRLLPKCNHSFHIGCIDMWFHSHSTCPLCRSPVEPAVNRTEPPPVVVVEVAEDVSESEPGSSSRCGLCDTCQHEERNANASGGHTVSLGGRRKGMDVKIDVGRLGRRGELNELTQSSPITRLLSFKRLLNICVKSPVGAETSRAVDELDLECGLGEPIRVHTPK